MKEKSIIDQMKYDHLCKMFRFFICFNLIIVHVFCLITEDYTEFTTNFSVTQLWQEDTSQSWDQATTEQPVENNTSIDTTEGWKQFTTDGPFEPHTEMDTTQTWEELVTERTSEQEIFTTAQTTTRTVPTTCPPGITPDILEELKKEIIEAVLRNISRELADKLEEMEERMSTLNCPKSENNTTSPAIKLSWQIYQNFQIPLTGWLRVFDQPYSHKTRIDDLNQLAGICHNEVLVAATYNESISLAAVGPASILTLNTLWNQPQQFGEVYWYRNSGRSFGFSPNLMIRQTSADNEDLASPLRLSWLLDQNMGGYRAGITRSLAENFFWHKVIYCN